jgi:hypothetical protein
MREERDDQGKQKSFCARRELWVENQESWVTKYEVGNAESLIALPSIASQKNGEAFGWESSSSDGDVIAAFESRFNIRAISKIT